MMVLFAYLKRLALACVSKRTKTTTTSTSTVTPDDTDSVPGTSSAQPLCFITFQTGPCLECIPDDVWHEILSHLPTLSDAHVLFGFFLLDPPVIPSTSLVRTPTLRALSQTSRILRSRFLAMAWKRIELCGVSFPKHRVTYYEAIGEKTKVAVDVLKTCPHLWPLIQTASIILTPYQPDEIFPPLAACLAMLPKLSTIQVVHARFELRSAIKNAFEGKRFPAVRKISLACSAHGIIESCPNLEEVICTFGGGSLIVGSLVEGNCHQVRILKGFTAPLTPLITSLSNNLRYVSVSTGRYLEQLTSFPLLDTIEIDLHWSSSLGDNVPLREIAASDVTEASKILKENHSTAEKMVVVTGWSSAYLSRDDDECSKIDINKGCMAIEAIRV